MCINSCRTEHHLTICIWQLYIFYECLYNVRSCTLCFNHLNECQIYYIKNSYLKGCITNTYKCHPHPYIRSCFYTRTVTLSKCWRDQEVFKSKQNPGCSIADNAFVIKDGPNAWTAFSKANTSDRTCDIFQLWWAIIISNIVA